MGQNRQKTARRGERAAANAASAALYREALRHFRANRLAEAVELFQRVLTADPRHADSLHHLGMIALRIGHADDAISLSRQVLTFAPDHAGAHRTLADAFATTGRLTDAEKHYGHALALNPDVMTYANLAAVHVAGGDIPRALLAAARGLKIRETPKLKSLFVNGLRNTASVPDDPDVRAFFLRAVTEPWQRPGNLARVSVAVLKQNPAIAAALDRAAALWPGRATISDLYGHDGLGIASRDPLLKALLENTQFADVGLERLLTLTRSALLDAMTEGGGAMSADAGVLPFFCALAQQCFTNEYVFACPGDETGKVRALAERLSAAAARGEQPDPLAIAAFAAYRPLHTLAAAEALRNLPWPACVQSIFTRQIVEPMAERALRDGIPRLTPINDEVSARVREQYEENPYPRWVKTAPDMAPDTIDRLMQSRQPDAPYRPLGKTGAVDILIAGCGTGQQVVEIASSILNARITAIDLSLSSLSYAKHRTDSLGLRNIEYGQADILELASLGRAFDMIVSTGVLHHMSDPLRGWRTLLSVLRPNGLMRIALYSETARADIVAAREFIAARGHGSTVEDIRRARQEIMALDGSAAARGVADSGDFFGTSTCRDLLFHVQETRFTLPRIKAFLDENGLEFLGFLLRPQRRKGYLALFPEDRGCTNLENWHEFEQRNPAFFRGMYQFHVQKRP